MCRSPFEDANAPTGPTSWDTYREEEDRRTVVSSLSNDELELALRHPEINGRLNPVPRAVDTITCFHPLEYRSMGREEKERVLENTRRHVRNLYRYLDETAHVIGRAVLTERRLEVGFLENKEAAQRDLLRASSYDPEFEERQRRYSGSQNRAAWMRSPKPYPTMENYHWFQAYREGRPIEWGSHRASSSSRTSDRSSSRLSSHHGSTSDRTRSDSRTSVSSSSHRRIEDGYSRHRSETMRSGSRTAVPSSSQRRTEDGHSRHRSGSTRPETRSVAPSSSHGRREDGPGRTRPDRRSVVSSSSSRHRDQDSSHSHVSRKSRSRLE